MHGLTPEMHIRFEMIYAKSTAVAVSVLVPMSMGRKVRKVLASGQ